MSGKLGYTTYSNTSRDGVSTMTGSRFMTAAPNGVQVYASTHDYIAENLARQSTGFNIPGDLAGWDVADGFLLSESEGAGGQSEWRISVFVDEIYAVLRKMPHADRYTFDGPVWLLDRVPVSLGVTVWDRPLRALTDEIEQHRGKPDSLLEATRIVRTTFDVLRKSEIERPIGLA